MEDQTENRDSRGALSLTTPTTATSQPVLNAKLLGTEFERSADREIVARIILRLAAVFGDPWGRDERSAKVMRGEWEIALADLPAVVIDTAVTEWTRTQTKWPRPADIRSIADRLLRAPIEAAAQRHGLHPKRIEPDETMKGFVFSESPLRRNPKWRQWLDGQHPSAEHFFFAKAQFIEPHEIFGLTDFEADYIRQKFGRELTKQFGRAVGLGIGPHPCREILWTEEQIAPPDDASKARVREMVQKFVSRNRAPAAKTPDRKVNLDGASPQFLDLIGAEHPVPESAASGTAANQTTSPPTGSDDFSDTRQRPESEAARN